MVNLETHEWREVEDEDAAYAPDEWGVGSVPGWARRRAPAFLEASVSLLKNLLSLQESPVASQEALL